SQLPTQYSQLPTQYSLLPTQNSPLNTPNSKLPTPISFLDLRDVLFEKKWNEEVRMLLDVPNFGPKVRALDGKKVEISGFVIPYDKSADLWVLSENPFASCFFCGGAGPETVMSLYFVKSSDAGLHTDDYVKVSGVFRINERDVFELAYRLEDAKVVE
ncbi:MAG: hypothetical protein ACI9YL_002164, partial [Luteibaculaceae bacterium]